uniref:Uncharacterized protein n=1 Tax=viral metagenome TaxID=1070528 RepID=A0A6C0ADU1_9ZZZZ
MTFKKVGYFYLGRSSNKFLINEFFIYFSLNKNV